MKRRVVSILFLACTSISFMAMAQDSEMIKRAPRAGIEDAPCDVLRAPRAEDQMVVLPYAVMAELTKVLDKVLDRAPRPDASTLANVAYPVSFDCADIDLIRRCVCLIKQQLAVICTKLDFIIDEIASCCEGIFEEFSVVEVAIANAVESICECVSASNSIQDVYLTSVIEQAAADSAATACECINLSNSAQSELLTSIVETVVTNAVATICECVSESNASQSELLASLIDQAAANVAATVCECINVSNESQSDLLISVIDQAASTVAATVCECINTSNASQTELLGSLIDQASANAAATACECIDLSNSAQSVLLTSIIETAAASSNSTVCECVNNLISASDVFLTSVIEGAASTAGTQACDCITTGLNNQASFIETEIQGAISSVCDCVSANADSLRVDLASCCEKIGNLSDEGSCFDSQLPDVATAINNANLNVIQWLKTIMLELRGCSCGGINPCQPSCGPGMTCVDLVSFNDLVECCNTFSGLTCIDAAILCPACIGLGLTVCVDAGSLESLLGCVQNCILP